MVNRQYRRWAKKEGKRLESKGLTIEQILVRLGQKDAYIFQLEIEVARLTQELARWEAERAISKEGLYAEQDIAREAPREESS